MTVFQEQTLLLLVVVALLVVLALIGRAILQSLGDIRVSAQGQWGSLAAMEESLAAMEESLTEIERLLANNQAAPPPSPTPPRR